MHSDMIEMQGEPTQMLTTAAERADEELTVYRSDEFRMFCFKVLRCSKRHPHDWMSCPFAHPCEKAKRRHPLCHTGIACPAMKTNFQCPRGETCKFAHNVFEYWLHPTRYHTQLCNDGIHCSRSICFFAHTLEELRDSSPAMSNKALKQYIASGRKQQKQQQGLMTFPDGDAQFPVGRHTGSRRMLLADGADWGEPPGFHQLPDDDGPAAAGAHAQLRRHGGRGHAGGGGSLRGRAGPSHQHGGGQLPGRRPGRLGSLGQYLTGSPPVTLGPAVPAGHAGLAVSMGHVVPAVHMGHMVPAVHMGRTDGPMGGPLATVPLQALSQQQQQQQMDSSSSVPTPAATAVHLQQFASSGASDQHLGVDRLAETFSQLGGDSSGMALTAGTLFGGRLTAGTPAGGTLTGATLAGGTLTGATLAGGTMTGGTLTSDPVADAELTCLMHQSQMQHEMETGQQYGHGAGQYGQGTGQYGQAPLVQYIVQAPHGQFAQAPGQYAHGDGQYGTPAVQYVHYYSHPQAPLPMMYDQYGMYQDVPFGGGQHAGRTSHQQYPGGTQAQLPGMPHGAPLPMHSMSLHGSFNRRGTGMTVHGATADWQQQQTQQCGWRRTSDPAAGSLVRPVLISNSQLAIPSFLSEPYVAAYPPDAGSGAAAAAGAARAAAAAAPPAAVPAHLQTRRIVVSQAACLAPTPSTSPWAVGDDALHGDANTEGSLEGPALQIVPCGAGSEVQRPDVSLLSGLEAVRNILPPVPEDESDLDP